MGGGDIMIWRLYLVLVIIGKMEIKIIAGELNSKK